MTAPSPTARGTPSGIRIPDGFSTKVTFASQTTLSVWERDVKPPGGDGGELIDITTMHNTKYKTKYPRTIVDISDGTMVCGIDPSALSTLDALVNRPDTVTVTYPDGSTAAYYAALIKYDPSEFKIGEFPLFTLTFGIMDYDYTAHSEVGPAYASVSGT